MNNIDNEKRFNELLQTDLPRFWDTFRNEMVYPQLIGSRVIFYHILDGEQPRIMKSLTDMLMNQRFIRMHPTSLKDKNGKLIYEGDLMNIKNKSGTVFKRVEVKYNSWLCAFMINDFDNISQYINPLNTENWKFEIIGDIHSNPELLGEKL